MKDAEAFAQGRVGDLDGLMRELNGWVGSLTAAMGDLAEQRLEGTDPTQTVRAAVTGTGRLLTLSIDTQKLRGLDHVELAEAVQEAIGAARLAIGERVAELMRDVAGAQTSADDSDPLAPYIQNVLREG
ncbi:YbaB/EbfC family nucleoid-associated protein [Nonomuraea sp. bgisy101]|uniref:YbaB/EbfC family nucleoid-associated protein n=1 Tax=Nonomuraea sp. bgisy101 TaxID=3413784 RepID=UPI003D728D79